MSIEAASVTSNGAWVGLNVSKDMIDACLLRTSGKPQHKTFTNDTAGHRKLLRWVQHLGTGQAYHFALEATGAYSQALAEFLAAAQQKVSVLNPARVKYGGIASGQGNKTDPEMAQPSTRPTPKPLPTTAACTRRRYGSRPVPKCDT